VIAHCASPEPRVLFSQLGKWHDFASRKRNVCWFIATKSLPETGRSKSKPEDLTERHGESACTAVRRLDLGPSGGAAKKKSTDPPVHLLNFRPTHPPSDFFFLDFFFSTFLGRFSARGVQKHHKNIFAKSPCRKPFDKKFDVNFSSTFFVLSRFRVFFSDGSSKTQQKTFCKKNRVEKFLQKVRHKSQNRLFLGFSFSHVFGRFSMRGGQKHNKKISKK
jgi:hypothetical protein